jgi:hypothetical protein
VEVRTANATEFDGHEGLVLTEGRLVENVNAQIVSSVGDDGAHATVTGMCHCLFSLTND